MVIGVTGTGKSSFCNFYFRENIFDTDDGAISVTERAIAHCCSINNIRFKFIDTPGFCDELEENNKRIAELGEALLHAQNGVHAIAICINGRNRFSTADGSLCEELKYLGSFWHHSFLVYTHSSTMGNSEQLIDERLFSWLNNPKCPKKMSDLFNYVNHRFLTIETTRCNDAGYYQVKCVQLINHIRDVYIKNQQKCYTNELFKWAKFRYDEQCETFKQALIEKEKEVQASAECVEMWKAKQREINEITVQSLKEKDRLVEKVEELEINRDQLANALSEHAATHTARQTQLKAELEQTKAKLETINAEKLVIENSLLKYHEQEANISETLQNVQEILTKTQVQLKELSNEKNIANASLKQMMSEKAELQSEIKKLLESHNKLLQSKADLSTELEKEKKRYIKCSLM